jgi:hypothetical protein
MEWEDSCRQHTAKRLVDDRRFSTQEPCGSQSGMRWILVLSNYPNREVVYCRQASRDEDRMFTGVKHDPRPLYQLLHIWHARDIATCVHVVLNSVETLT